MCDELDQKVGSLGREDQSRSQLERETFKCSCQVVCEILEPHVRKVKSLAGPLRWSPGEGGNRATKDSILFVGGGWSY